MPSSTEPIRLRRSILTDSKRGGTRGKPVIASEVGEPAFRVKHGINGLLVEPGNPQELAEALQTITEKLLKPRSSTLLTWCQIAKRLIAIY